MRFFAYVVSLISLVSISLYVFLFFKDWNNYKEYIIQKLEDTYDIKVHIGGKIKVLLVAPKLIIYNVNVQHNNVSEQRLLDFISINKIEVKPSFLSLFLLSLQLKSVTLFGAESSKEGIIDLTSKIGNKIDLIIKDSKVNLGNSFIGYNNVVDIKEIAIKRNGHFVGEINVNSKNYNFLGNVNILKKNVSVSFESNVIKFLFTGSKNQKELQGKLMLIVNNSSNFINDLIRIVNPSFISDIIPSESIEVFSKVNFDNDRFMVTDLKINSKSIKINGTMSNNSRDNHIDINISSGKVDLDHIQNDLRKTIEVRDFLECFRKVIPKNLSLDFYVNDLNIKYQNRELGKFHTALKFADAEAEISMLICFSGINNKFHLSGKISSNEILSEFNGGFLIKGTNLESFISYFLPFKNMKENKENQFRITSKLHLAPRILYISDIRLLLGDKEFLYGSIRIGYMGKRNTVNGTISMHNFDADKYDCSLFNDLFEVKWLKSSRYDVNIEFSISNTVVNNIKIEYVNFLLRVEKGKLILDNIKLLGKDFDVVGNIKMLVDKEYVRPLLDIDLAGNKFNGSFLKLPNLLEIKRDFKNEINQIQWSKDQTIILNNKKDFDATIKISVLEFRNDPSIYKDFSLNAVMINNIVTFKRVNYTFGCGKLSFQGYLRSDSIYVRFFIENLDVKRVARAVGVNNIDGQINLDGVIKANGKSFSDWVNNLTGEISFRTKGIEFTNVDFNSFIVNLLNSKNKSEISVFANFDMYNGSTFFGDINGKASIKNGICSTSLQFKIDKASGVVSSNLALFNFTLVSLSRFFFIPQGYNNPIYIDMHLDGPIWRLKMNFDEDQIFAFIKN
ncbi:MAG: AsmA-like C-terminal region-containing protein [Wolbachia endosymbiont of Menacanthus eurysternus]|nr:MAG: AsmA-like C-terminal region-containing protein [Wolbachia endosymbiont of Menacanthus eurysternus]